MISSEYHFFWGGPFSNWYESPFATTLAFSPDFGVIYSTNYCQYNCVEQYMMAQKAFISKDYITLDKIFKTNAPKIQKQLGRQIKNFNSKLWDLIKFDIVYCGCMEKFVCHHDLRSELLNTGDAILVEASPHDRIWGIGYGEEDALQNIQNWGENLLGKVLMKVRSVLQAANT